MPSWMAVEIAKKLSEFLVLEDVNFLFQKEQSFFWASDHKEI